MARRIVVQAIGDFAHLERSFDRAGDKSEKFGKRMGSSLKSMAKVGAVGVAAGGVAVLTKQLFSSVAAAKESEAAAVRLSGAFKSAGVNQKEYARAQKEISRVSKLAALDDEDLSDALAKLTRTTGSATKGLKGMELAANIARARGISLAAASKIVEKAHIGQMRGLKAVGVEIDKNTTVTEALERAQRKFAGSAAAYGNTAAGAQDKLSVAFENLQEKVGQKLLPVLQRLALKLIDLIDWTERNWPKFSKAVSDAYDRIRPVIENIKTAVKGIANVIAGVVKVIVAIKNGEWGQVWDGLRQVAVDGLGKLVKAALALPALIVKALGKAAWKGLEKVGGYIGDAIAAGLKAAVSAVVATVKAIINKAIDVINAAIDALNKPADILNRFTPGSVAPKVPKVPKIGGGGGGGGGESNGTPAAPSSNLPGTRRRAAGGPVSVGRSYLVGEKGPELFTPGRGGQISPDGAGGVHIGTVHLHGVQNAHQLLAELQRIARTGSAPRRGHFGGTNLGIG